MDSTMKNISISIEGCYHSKCIMSKIPESENVIEPQTKIEGLITNN
jgi:hypothetical protein